jgi:hypothetical protein
MSMKSRRDDTDRGKMKNWETSDTSSTTNPTWADPDANTGLRAERLTTKRMSHGTAILRQNPNIW